VLRKWEPYFDPFSATIERSDQWIKITRLPLELWEEDFLKQLLHDVGHYLKVDDITLNRSKGKFARVCLNIDITKPLRGSLFIPIPNQSRPLEVPISYEGLHEVCALCGSDAHDLEACPDTPKGPLEVIVEKFGATKIHTENELNHTSPPPVIPPNEKWITVVPKKRGRLLSLPKRKSVPKVVLGPASPTVKLMPSSSNSETLDGLKTHQGSREEILPPATGVEAVLAPAPPLSRLAAAQTPPVGPSVAAPTGSASSPTLAPAGSGTTRPVPSPVVDPAHASPLEDSELEDDDVSMFFNMEPEEDVAISSDSTKKRRLDEGDVASPSTSLN